ncbi:restriction endonuclease [Sorangium sp. So ce362]|uniref:restriction endonuclease n=1 Tax=Sorangium sp. So ce362 TaxID=3133303 RepID=UPI003F6385C6
MKRYSAQVADAVVEALATSFHYKEDLGSFLVRCGVPGDTVQACQFTRNGPPRRVSARMLVDGLAAHPATGTELMRLIIQGLLAEDLDFPRLRKLEDGEQRVASARRALSELKDLVSGEFAAERRKRERQDGLEKSRLDASLIQHRASMLRGLRGRFMALFAASDHQGRGKQFEVLLKDLFELFDLSPRGSFRPDGEEIDGSIIHEGQHILVEAKWETKPIETAPIGVFRQKVEDKLKTTLGLFVSMSGYSPAAVEKAGGGGARSMILMEGTELMPVFEGQVDLRDLLARKIRRAHETGEAFFKPYS